MINHFPEDGNVRATHTINRNKLRLVLRSKCDRKIRTVYRSKNVVINLERDKIKETPLRREIFDELYYIKTSADKNKIKLRMQKGKA